MSRPIESFSLQTRRSRDCGRRLRFIEGAVAEHREQHVGPASGEAEQGLGVVLALGDVRSVRGALPALLLVGFPEPPPEPGVPVSEHRALHKSPSDRLGVLIPWWARAKESPLPGID